MKYVSGALTPREQVGDVLRWLRLANEQPRTSEGRAVRSHLPHDMLADLLSNAEILVFDGMARGLPDKAIAAELTLSQKTVRNRVSQILAVFGCQNRTAAVMYAVQRGWVRL